MCSDTDRFDLCLTSNEPASWHLQYYNYRLVLKLETIQTKSILETTTLNIGGLFLQCKTRQLLFPVQKISLLESIPQLPVLHGILCHPGWIPGVCLLLQDAYLPHDRICGITD